MSSSGGRRGFWYSAWIATSSPLCIPALFEHRVPPSTSHEGVRPLAVRAKGEGITAQTEEGQSRKKRNGKGLGGATRFFILIRGERGDRAKGRRARYAFCAVNAETSKIALPFDHVKAHAHLSTIDKRLARLIERVGEFQFKLDECDSVYESLLEAITHQSIAGTAARVIFARIVALGTNGKCPTPQELLRVRKPKLRQVGLSFAKIAAVRDLAQKTIDGVVPTIETAETMSDEELVERLISVRGIGAWTVEMFLIFRLGRPDVLPIHDYGVQKGFALTYGKKNIPRPRELAAFGEKWRPFRTVASWYMWRAVGLAGKSARKIKKAPPVKKRTGASKSAAKPAPAKLGRAKNGRKRGA